MRILIEISEQDMELTVSEAREVYDKLSEIFRQSDPYPYIPKEYGDPIIPTKDRTDAIPIVPRCMTTEGV